ncbi:MAG: hypothetical protein CTY33_02975 [Methylotenera sp.]|nr:MAG: hypothetical protein CTY33_02975 [Methylotenera sp.]
MTDNVAHFYSSDSVEHPINGVITELSFENEIDLIEKNISTWMKNDRLDCLMLRALLQLSKRANKAQTEFTPQEIVETISLVRNRRWSTGNDKERMSDDVRRTWKKLEHLWQSKLEGITQSLLDAGLQHYPKLTRIEGGGTGKLTKYRIEWQDISTPLITTEINFYAKQPNFPLQIKYICEDIKDAGFLASIFATGLILSGWRRWLYIATLLIPMLLMLIFAIFFILNLALFDSPKNQLGTLITCLLTVFTIYISIYPMVHIKSKGILLAPWWMQSDDEERLLEFRKPPRFVGRSIKAVSYTSTCPICQGKITAKSGGLEFFGRIVGRCDEAPVEHVFSFDYITRQGRWLRA